MDVDNRKLWRALRGRVVAAGALRTLRRIAKGDGGAVEDVLHAYVLHESPASVLRALAGVTPRPEDDKDELEQAAFDQLLRLVTPGERLPARAARVGHATALRIFDAWSEHGDDRGAGLNGQLIALWGTHVARLIYDRGYPGSAEVMSAFTVGTRIYLVSEDSGAYAAHRTLNGVLREWAEFERAEIWCRGMTAEQTRQAVDVAGARSYRTTAVADARVDRSTINSPWWPPRPAGDAAPAEPLIVTSAAEYEARGHERAAAGDHAGALHNWRFAASKGSAAASWKLAGMYCRGRGVTRDISEAARRCRAAADGEHGGAMVRMARAYHRIAHQGRAEFWHRRAAERGVDVRGLDRRRGCRAQRLEEDARSPGERRTTSDVPGERVTEVVTQFGRLVSQNRIEDATAAWLALVRHLPRLRLDDALVLELSGGAAHWAAQAVSDRSGSQECEV